MVRVMYQVKSKTDDRFSWKERAESFTYAYKGLKALFRTEHNARIHVGLTVAALLLSVSLRISTIEFLVLVLAIAIVFATELINTAIEKSMDFICLERHPQIAVVKDLAAAAVLVSAVAAFIIGAIIFLPKLLIYV